MFSIENGNDCRIKTEKYLTDALKYVETDENAKEIFEFNDDDTECLGDLDYVNACLGISLRQARKNFLVKRACKDEFMSEVRLCL